MIYSKTLQGQLVSAWVTQHLFHVSRALAGVPHRLDHFFRIWEYGLVLAALQANEAKTVLEIGGGGSLFAPAAAMLGMEILQVDLKDCTHWTAKQEEKLGVSLPYVQQDFFEYATEERFDAVVSISVIEHVSADASRQINTDEWHTAKRVQFFERMLNLVKPGGLVAITTDFHPDKPRNIKFSEAEMLALYEIGRSRGFDWFGAGYDYTYAGDFVNYYTFASLILKRAT